MLFRRIYMKKNIKKTILIAECLVLSSMMIACSFPGKKEKKNEETSTQVGNYD